LKEYPQISFEIESSTDKEGANGKIPPVLNLTFKSDSPNGPEATVGLLNEDPKDDQKE